MRHFLDEVSAVAEEIDSLRGELRAVESLHSRQGTSGRRNERPFTVAIDSWYPRAFRLRCTLAPFRRARLIVLDAMTAVQWALPPVHSSPRV